MIKRISFLRKKNHRTKEYTHTNDIHQRIKMLEKLGVEVSIIDKNAKHITGYVLGNMKDIYN